MKQPDLLFEDFLNSFNHLGEEEWTVAYSGDRDDGDESSFFYCALISKKHFDKSLTDPSWDLSIGGGLPGLSYHFKNRKEYPTYERYSDDGVEPLIIKRNFNGIKEPYWEISQEFCQYFNLYEDKDNHKFSLIDDCGDDEDVVLIGEDEIKIKTRLIKEFVSVKGMYFAIFFDLGRFSENALEELKIDEHHEHKSGDNFIYSIGISKWEGFTYNNKKTFAYLRGKKFISGSKELIPKVSYKDKKEYVEYVIDVNSDGKEIKFTCDEDKLANFFGKNSDSPNYVTPVVFKKDVLTKYYSQPGKYSVEDGYLRCAGLWGLRMDNNHPDYVGVFLGDLGHLPYKEQLYWKSFNVSMKGKISHVAWERGFEVKFADPEKSDLYFRYKYDTFQRDWKKKFGWNFFKPLSKEDEHHLKTLHVPVTNEQKEFDEQVLSLTKVIIDSLNEDEIQKQIPAGNSGSKGIDKLEQFLQTNGVNNTSMIRFLRNLQSLRSTGVAHRKGDNYEKTKEYFSIGKKGLSEVFDNILVKSIWFLNTIENHCLKV